MLTSVTIGSAFLGLAMFYSIYLWHHLYHRRLRGHDDWFTPSDIWSVVDAGRYVWHGLLGYVYQGSDSYALPLSFVITAPASALVDHFNLAEGIFEIPRPTAWILIGPFSLLFGIFLLDAVRRLAWELGLTRRLWLVQVLAVLVVLVPGFEWGHFEDTIALTFALHAIRYLMKADYFRASLLLSLAISSKQWAVVLLPLVVILSPPGRRLKCLVAASFLPMLFLAVLLGFGGQVAFDALFSPVNLGRQTNGHVAFYVTWLGSKTSRTSRTLGVLVSPLVAWLCRRASDPAGVLAAVSLLLLLRPFFEAINYSYYWSPSFLLAGMVGVAAHGQVRVRDWIWQVLAIVWSLPHGNAGTSTFWWIIQMVFVSGTALQVGRNCGVTYPTVANVAELVGGHRQQETRRSKSGA